LPPGSSWLVVERMTSPRTSVSDKVIVRSMLGFGVRVTIT
jgi:hypothetical protein